MHITLTKMNSRGLDAMGRPYWRIRAPDPSWPGKRVTVESGRWTKLEAEDRLRAVLARETLGLELSPDSGHRWSVSDVVEAYLQDLAARTGETAYLDSETRRLAHVVSHLGPVMVDQLTRGRLEQFAGARRKDPTQHGGPTRKKSIREEVLSLRRAIRTCQELGRIDTGPPPMPSLKSIPDDKRPHRRLTEEEVARILEAADVLDPREVEGPAEGTRTREVLDHIRAHPGCQARDLRTATSATSRDLGGYTGWLRRMGLIVAEGRRGSLRYYPARDDLEAPRYRGLRHLLTVLAWTGRRPVAVFALEREDCVRVLDQELPRAERLAFWRRDKGGVGRGWGPVPQPALEALAARCAEVEAGHLWSRPITSEPYAAEDVGRLYKRCAELAGVEGTQLYDLRRFAVTRLLRQAQGQVAVVQRFTGHRTVQALMTYVYAEQDAAESLAEHVGWSGRGLRAVD